MMVYPADSLLGDKVCFVLDNHLGRLAMYLRMLGFDTLYRNDYQDPELAIYRRKRGARAAARATGGC